MFVSPEQNIAHISLRPNMRVADFGVGSGAYALLVAKKIAEENGQVFAIDVQKDLLDRVKSEAERLKLSNLEFIWADIETKNGTKLADDSIDAAVVSNVLFQVESKTGLIAEVKRVLKPGGQVLLIDWTDSFGGMGPDQNMIVSADNARLLFTNAGFAVRKDFDAGDHHYGLILQKQ